MFSISKFIKYVPLFCLFIFFSCGNENALEKEISALDVELNIERFDWAVAKAKTGDLPRLKKTYPFLFSKRIPDSIWVKRLQDSLQTELSVSYTHLTLPTTSRV